MTITTNTPTTTTTTTTEEHAHTMVAVVIVCAYDERWNHDCIPRPITFFIDTGFESCRKT